MQHSPNVVKIEILRRSKVRRNFLSYMRERRGKSARLTEVGFDKAAANAANTSEIKEETTVLPAGETELVAATDQEQSAENTEAIKPKESKKAVKTASEDNASKTKEPKVKKEIKDKKTSK